MTMHDTSSQLLMEQSSRLCLNLDPDHVTKRAEAKVCDHCNIIETQKFPKSSGGWYLPVGTGNNRTS